MHDILCYASTQFVCTTMLSALHACPSSAGTVSLRVLIRRGSTAAGTQEAFGEICTSANYICGSKAPSRDEERVRPALYAATTAMHSTRPAWSTILRPDRNLGCRVSTALVNPSVKRMKHVAKTVAASMSGSMKAGFGLTT